MKNPLLVVLGTTLFWATSSSHGSAVPLDTLKINLIKPFNRVPAGAGKATDFPPMPGSCFLEPDLSMLRLLRTASGRQEFAFDLPVSSTQSLPLLVHEIAVVAPDFRISTSSGKTPPLPSLRFFSGKVAGDDSSTVVLSLSETGIEGLIYGKKYAYTLGKIRNTTTNQLHVVYQTQDLPAQTGQYCKTEPIPASEPSGPAQQPTSRRMASSLCKGVGVSLEVDYQMYQDWQQDLSYISSVVLATFANVVTLYAQENIRIELSELKIWDTPDPYGEAGSPGELLAQFKSYWNTRRNAFNGDIAHLLSTRMSHGGVAYYGISRRNTVSTLNDIAAVFSQPESRSFAFSVSTGLYATLLDPLPTYTYNVYIIAHELGHNFGLPHTHSCLWKGGPLDNCGPVEDGTCPPGPAPTNQGTIMSYCPNLANGFGAQPAAKMKYEYLAAQNLSNPGENPVLIIPAAVTANHSQYTEFEIANCSGTVLWSDGVSSGNSRTLLPTESSTYYAACLVEGCVSASAQTSVTTECVKPALCTIGASSILSTLSGIASFSFNTLLTDTPNGVPANLGTYYEDFTCTQHTLVKAGESYAFTLSGTFGNSLFAKIYIDYNGNGQFTDANELVYNGLSLFRHAGTITIPTSALRVTPLRMRVMLNPLLIPNACSLPSSLFSLSGKVNDYALTITDSTCPPRFRETVKSGRWDDPLVWSCGSLPTTLDQVKINPGHYITLPADASAFAGTIDLRGVIQPGSNSRLRIE